MPCSCGRAARECEDMCHCCPFLCMCQQCFEIRNRHGAYCRPCGGRLAPDLCSQIPFWRSVGLYPNYPSLDFLRAATHQVFINTPDERRNVGGSTSNVTHSCPTTSRRFAPEASQCPPRESPNYDDNLIFQMDDIDFSPSDVSTSTSTGAKSKDFQESSHSGSNTSASGTTPFELREPPKRIRECFRHSSDAAGMKSTETPKCKMPIWIPLHRPDDESEVNLGESQSEVPISTQDVIGCSHSNPITNTFETEEPRVAKATPLLTVTDLNRTELTEKETSNIPQSASYAVSLSADEYASDSLPLNLHSDDSPHSTISVSPRSLVLPPTSEPSIYDLSESTCELKFSEQKSAIVLGTPETSPTSNLPKFETLKISDSHPMDKSQTSSKSILPTEMLPENLPNEAPGIPSNSVPSSQSNNTVIQTGPTQPSEASETLSISNSFKLQSPEVSKSDEQKTSSKSDQTNETISKEETNDYSEVETPTNNSPTKNNLFGVGFQN